PDEGTSGEARGGDTRGERSWNSPGKSERKGITDESFKVSRFQSFRESGTRAGAGWFEVVAGVLRPLLLSQVSLLRRRKHAPSGAGAGGMLKFDELIVRPERA